MKKEYIKPAMQVVLLQHQSHLMQASGEAVRSMGGSPEGFSYDDVEDEDILR
jgi:hypothetical protein